MKHPPPKLPPNVFIEVKELERNCDSSAVFQIPGTSWFFDSKFFEYSKPAPIL
jgi:hypothetical protein